MSESTLRLECLKQAVIVCSKQQPGAPRSDDVVRAAEKFLAWVSKKGPSARDLEDAE
jgi:hypothetical protein